MFSFLFLGQGVLKCPLPRPTHDLGSLTLFFSLRADPPLRLSFFPRVGSGAQMGAVQPLSEEVGLLLLSGLRGALCVKMVNDSKDRQKKRRNIKKDLAGYKECSLYRIKGLFLYK